MTIQLTKRIWLVGSGALGFGMTDDFDCHVYLLDGGTEAALIDTGAGRDTDAILGNVCEAIGSLDRLKHVLITHYHADHSGGAAEIRERTGAVVWAPRGATPAISEGNERQIQLESARKAGAYPPEYLYRPCPIDRLLDDDDEVIVGDIHLQVLLTPGHCDYHVSFYGTVAGRQVLFDADCIFYGGKVCLQAIPDCRIDALAASAQRLAELDVDVLCPGHLEIALSGGSRHIAQAMSYFSRLVPPPNII